MRARSDRDRGRIASGGAGGTRRRTTKEAGAMQQETLIERVKKICERHDVPRITMARISRMSSPWLSRMMTGDIPIDSAAKERIELALEIITALAAQAEPLPVNFRRWRLIQPFILEFRNKSLAR